MLPPCRGSPHSVPPPALALPMYTQGQHPHSSQVLTSYTTHIHTHNFLTSLSLGYLCTVQDSSVAQSCLCDPMNCSTPGLPIHHQLLELTQTHVHQVSDTIQSSHFLSSPSPPTFNLSQQKVQGFCACWYSYSDGFMIFYFFFNSHPYVGFIYPEMEGICSCRPQSMVYIKQFNYFLLSHDFSLLLGRTFSIASGMSYKSQDII